MDTSTFRRTFLGFILGTTLVVTTACGNPDDPDEQIPPDETVAAVESPTPPSANDRTAIPGLTDTGYLAPDGRPLYAECIQEGAPLPPEVPVPEGTAEPRPTLGPGEDANGAKPTPMAADLPTFDLRTIEPANTDGWVKHESLCYGYSILLPPTWAPPGSAAGGPTPAAGDFTFSNAGYQQGEAATFFSPGKTAKIDISASWTPVEQLSANYSFEDPRAYYLEAKTDSTESGLRRRLLYSRTTEPGFEGVVLSETIEVRPDWYLSFNVLVKEPYDEEVAAQAAAIIESLSVEP